MRIGLLMGRSFTDGSLMPEVVHWLGQLGAAAEPVHLGDDLIDVARVRLDCDLYVLKNTDDLAMSVAADLYGAGAALLNPYPVSAMLRDRIVTFRVLRAAGIPVPETFVASHMSQLLPALDRGPLIVKPYRRSRKRDSHVVRDAAELAAVGLIEEPVFAQRYHQPDGPDRQIYSIGGHLFGMCQVGLARTPQERQGRPCSLSLEHVDIARRCGAAFGIDLFGVEVVESEGRAFVVDVSSFPGFKGVPDAPLRLAQHIHAAAERAARGEPIVPAASLATRPVTTLHAFNGSTLDLVLHALSTTPATPQELDFIQSLLDESRIRSSTPVSSLRALAGSRRPGAWHASLPAGARLPRSAAVPGLVMPSLSPAWEGALPLRSPTRGTAAPAAVPASGGHVSAKCVAFRGPPAGDQDRFLVEQWTTEFADGTSSRDYIWVRGRYVLVVPISDGGVVFIRQYKKAAAQTLLVLPWGEVERGESPLDAGRRELEEETGYSFGTAEVYGPFCDLPDKSTGGHWVVVARNACLKADPAPDDGERICGIERIPVDRLWQHRIPVLMHVGALRLAGL